MPDTLPTSRLLRTCALAVAGATSLLAQTRFVERPDSAYPRLFHGSDVLHLVDLDHDGDLDALSASRGGQDHLYINDGLGGFTDETFPRLPVDTRATEAVALGDFDGDGDLDLLLGPTLRQLHNDGQGNFVDTGASWSRNTVGDWLVALDLDADGDVDVVGGSQRRNILLLNDGTGRLVESAAGRLPDYGDFSWGGAAGDLDSDGDLDLVIAGSGVYVNDGSGTFTKRSTPHRNAGVVRCGDLDGDGDLDLVFAKGRTNVLGEGYLLNDGAGSFAAAPAGNLPAIALQATDILLVDVDHDGDLDLVAAHQTACSSCEYRDRIYRNDGFGVFTEDFGTEISEDFSQGLSIAAGDVDGNGRTDLLIGSIGIPDRLHLQNDDGTYFQAPPRRLLHQTDPNRVVVSVFASGDLDGDGLVDLITGPAAFVRPQINDGGGLFRPTPRFVPSSSEASNAATLADVDLDGDLDLIVATRERTHSSGRPLGQDRLFLNDGRARFTDVSATSLPAVFDESRDVLAVDVDADGDRDLVFVSTPAAKLLLNDGAGRFQAAPAAQWPLAAPNGLSVVAEDFDGDGDADLCFGQYTGSGEVLLLNDGSGTFTDVSATRLPQTTSGCDSLVAVDVDGDGDVDLVLANRNSLRIYLNGGTATFVEAPAGSIPPLGTLRLRAGDLDDDGDIDLLVRTPTIPARSVLLHNDGRGRFHDATATETGPEFQRIRNADAVDVDHDGDLDIVHGTGVLVNMGRHLGTAHHRVRIGQDYEVRALVPSGPVATTVLPFASPRRGSTPLGTAGTFLLDLGALLPLPTRTLGPGQGEAVVQVPMPNDPALLGATVHTQALFVRSATDVRVSNLLQNRIRR